MKRVVTGLDAEGQSCVVATDELAPANWIELWRFRPDDLRENLAAVADELAAAEIEAAPGEVKWVAAVWPASMGALATDRPGVDDAGYHTTRTIDFVYLLSGRLTLILERESVELEPGDVVVQQAVRHAWRNDSGEDAALLAWSHAPAAGAT